MKAEQPQPSPRPLQDLNEPNPVCPGCLRPLPPMAHFCTACGMPISGTAMIDPLLRIYGTGWAYRKAMNSRPSPLILVGMWLIFAPMILLVVGTPLFGTGPLRGETQGYALAQTILTCGLLLIYAAILFKLTFRYYQVRRSRRSATGGSGPR